jgi:N-acetylmuramoyl-L-alanine amidase
MVRCGGIGWLGVIIGLVPMRLSAQPLPIPAIDLLAETGSGLTSIDANLSINDSGTIAFAGIDAQGSKGFIVSAAGGATAVTFFGPTRLFSGAAINDASPAQVVYRERVSGSPLITLVRRWSTGAGPATIVGRSGGGRICTGGINAGQSCTSNADCFCAPLDPFCTPGICTVPAQDFDSANSFVDLNDAGTVVFPALTGLDIGEVEETVLFAGSTPPPTALVRFPGAVSFQLRPQIANDGTVVFRAPDTGRISIVPATGGSSRTVDDGFPFTVTGFSPGISDDGRAIAFYGETGGRAGVFARVTFEDVPQTVAVAVVADPTEPDVDGNSVPDNQFSGFIRDDRIGVTSWLRPDGSFVVGVVFQGTLEGRHSVIYRELLFVEARLVYRSMPQRVLSVGDQIGSSGREAGSFVLYHPVNRHGVLGFWVGFAGGGAGIVRSSTACRSLVVDPGHGLELMRGRCSTALTKACVDAPSCPAGGSCLYKRCSPSPAGRTAAVCGTNADCPAAQTCSAVITPDRLVGGRAYKYQRDPVTGGTLGTATIVEDELTLSMGESARDALNRRLQTTTTEITRTDSFAPAACRLLTRTACLHWRINLAARRGAQAFVAVHTNGGLPTAGGVETYYCNSGGQARKSKSLAEHIHGQLLSLVDRRRDRGIRTSVVKDDGSSLDVCAWPVLGAGRVPAVLTEVAFHTNNVAPPLGVSDAEALADGGFRLAAGTGIAGALTSYCGVQP